VDDDELAEIRRLLVRAGSDPENGKH
jgi:hypothetical protein